MVKFSRNSLHTGFCANNIYSQGKNVLYILIYICLQSCMAMVSCKVSFMVDITHWDCLGYIPIDIALHGCIIYIQDWFFWCEFNCDVYCGIGLTCFGNFENSHICICFLYCFSTQIQLELICFGNFVNLLICISILYHFSTQIQL